MKNFFATFLLVLCLISAALAYFSWQFYVHPASSQPQKLVVDVPPGSNLTAVVQGLNSDKVLIPIISMKIWNTLTQASQKLKVGEYEINTSDSPHRILMSLINGPSKSYKITIKEGTHIWDILEVFKKSVLSVQDSTYMSWIQDPQRLDRMGVPHFKDPRVKRTLEGFLFPETYQFYKYHSPEEVIDHMLDLFEKRVKGLLAQHPWGNTPEGRYKLLILASIVEKESSSFEEQPIVASVYWNRIRKGMKLQADPTTIYGLMPNFNGNLTRANLTEATPYNTYAVTGLPPTPIANPSESAIRAVINPASTEYLFFVSKNDGTHIFSKDYATHNKYVNEFQRSKRSRSSEVDKNSRDNKQ